MERATEQREICKHCGKEKIHDGLEICFVCCNELRQWVREHPETRKVLAVILDYTWKHENC